MKQSLLVVDDDRRIRTSLAEALAGADLEVRTSEDGEAALAEVARRTPDMVLTDVRMPGMTGLELLSILKERTPGVAVILMTAFDDLATVVTAMKEGASDFLVKPVDLFQLQGIIAKVAQDREAAARDRVGLGVGVREDSGGGESEVRGAEPTEGGPDLIGHDPKMIRVFKIIGQVAESRTTVVVRGESGTGKELIAKAIHRSSPSAGEPFVAVNCTALPSALLESELFGHMRGSFTGASSDRKGRFALAGFGTVFLDEIGDTTLDFQSKLLRVLQEHEFYPVGAERPERTEARVIAATHRDLEAMVEKGAFREDLYYRLRIVEIQLPALRERISDLPELASHLVAKASRAVGRPPPVVSSEALEALMSHTWPGNVRELENCLTRASVLSTSGVIRSEHLALGPSPEAPPPRISTLEEAEGIHLAQVLKATGGHKTRTAEALGISRPRLDRLIEKHGLVDLARTRKSRPDEE
jgi:DNA-binding NtrC family response regulator